MGRFRKTVVILSLLLLLLLLVSPSNGETLEEKEKAITQRSREEQTRFWEREIAKLRHGDLNAALQNLYEAQRKLQQAKKNEGFFFTNKEDKATIKLLDEAYHQALVKVDKIKYEEDRMLAKLKPLYGLVSKQFVQEQKKSIKELITIVKDASYDNAFYSSLFDIGEAESLTDLIMMFVGKWIMNYLVFYPFAALYYAVWTAPRSVYAYSSGITDVVPAFLTYIISVLVMCSPLIVLVAGIYMVYRYSNVDLTARGRYQRGRARRHYD